MHKLERADKVAYATQCALARALTEQACSQQDKHRPPSTLHPWHQKYTADIPTSSKACLAFAWARLYVMVRPPRLGIVLVNENDACSW